MKCGKKRRALPRLLVVLNAENRLIQLGAKLIQEAFYKNHGLEEMERLDKIQDECLRKFNCTLKAIEKIEKL